MEMLFLIRNLLDCLVEYGELIWFQFENSFKDLFSYSSHNVLSQNLFDLFQTSYFFQTVRHTNFKIKYKLLTYFELLIHQKFQKSVNSTKTVFLVHYKYTIGTHKCDATNKRSTESRRSKF